MPILNNGSSSSRGRLPPVQQLNNTPPMAITSTSPPTAITSPTSPPAQQAANVAAQQAAQRQTLAPAQTAVAQKLSPPAAPVMLPPPPLQQPFMPAQQYSTLNNDPLFSSPSVPSANQQNMINNTLHPAAAPSPNLNANAAITSPTQANMMAANQNALASKQLLPVAINQSLSPVQTAVAQKLSAPAAAITSPPAAAITSPPSSPPVQQPALNQNNKNGS